MAIARERHKLTINRNHYHILIEDRGNMTFDDLIQSIIYASNRCETINSLDESDKEFLTRNHRLKKSRASGKCHMNLLKLENRADRDRLIEYVMKEGIDTNCGNMHIAVANDNRNYFPICTEA